MGRTPFLFALKIINNKSRNIFSPQKANQICFFLKTKNGGPIFKQKMEIFGSRRTGFL
jgi:hypothetical protein